MSLTLEEMRELDALQELQQDTANSNAYDENSSNLPNNAAATADDPQPTDPHEEANNEFELTVPPTLPPDFTPPHPDTTDEEDSDVSTMIRIWGHGNNGKNVYVPWKSAWAIKRHVSISIL